MLSPKCDLDKPGVERLDQVGSYAVIANKALHEKGHAHRYAVVNTRQQWVDSIHVTHHRALAHTRSLM